jgi:hypothetical protein
MPNHLTVDGFPQSFTDENLKEVFTLYGHVLTATIIYPHSVISLWARCNGDDGRGRASSRFRLSCHPWQSSMSGSPVSAE